jgi:alkylation response protein AidB-like acyl-CoA dehydrogenase
MSEHSLLESTRALAPLLKSLRAETERGRRLPGPLVEALIEAKLFRLTVSTVEGGLEVPPLVALQVFEELASVEGAAAWVVWNNTLPGMMSRFLPDEARRTLFASPRTVAASSTRPTGRAVREGVGYRIRGRWSLVSGCELADVVLLHVLVVPAEGAPGSPKMIMAYLSNADCHIVDTWHAGGLRGTGSHDVVVEDVWVPADHCVWFLHPLQLKTALYRMPFAATLSAGCASICLGLARGAFEALKSLAGAKVHVDRGVALSDRPALLCQVARMHSQLASARLLLHHAVRESWQVTESGCAVTLQQRASLWQAALHAAASAKDVMRTAYEAAGSDALYDSCPIERAHRDLHVVTQHVIVQDLWLEESGRVALGIPPLWPMFLS